MASSVFKRPENQLIQSAYFAPLQHHANLLHKASPSLFVHIDDIVERCVNDAPLERIHGLKQNGSPLRSSHFLLLFRRRFWTSASSLRRRNSPNRARFFMSLCPSVRTIDIGKAAAKHRYSGLFGD